MPSLDYYQQLLEEDKDRQAVLASYKQPVFTESYEEALLRALRNDPIVIAPYVHSYPEHVNALSTVGYDVTRIPCVGETTYYDTLVAVYSTGKPFVVIEHDMVPRPGDVKELFDCPYNWCGFVYQHRFQRMKACLGLTKLNLYSVYPDVFTKVPSDWRYIDGVLEARLWEKDVHIHEHYPEAIHLNPMVSVDGPKVDGSPEGLMQRTLFMARKDVLNR